MEISIMKWCLVTLVMIAGLTVLTGCGGQATTVTGAVLLDGQPLQGGFIVLYGSSGACVSTSIVNGTYEVRQPPRGGVTVAIFDGLPPMRREVAATAKSPRSSSVPMRYQSKETSPLKVEVKEGTNAFNVELVSVERR
jgi:hypothetical protein